MRKTNTINKRLTTNYKRLRIVILLLLMGFRLSAGAAATAQLPTYQFHSTSSYTSVVSQPLDFTPLADQPVVAYNSRPFASSPWDDDDDDGPGDLPTGAVDDPLPIGHPLALLFMALLYIGYKKYKRLTVCEQK